jgi:hypothetical protein
MLWSSLYLPTAQSQQVADVLNNLHQAAAYRPYNPFPGGPGTPQGVSQFVRLFLAPPEGGWTRLIGIPDVNLLTSLATALNLTLLHTFISEEEAHINAIGAAQLADFLRPGKTSADLERARQVTPVEGSAPASPMSDIAKQYGVNPKAADKLIQKSVGTIFNKLDQSAADAQAEVNKAAFSWGLPAAQRLSALMACLTLPENWRDPSYADLAAAYPIACLLDQDEDAPLLPGDEALLDKVEFPLDYTPFYYAK